MTIFPHIIRAYTHEAAEALKEAVWPTRCAVCDTPGEVLCEACLRALPYLDWWRACPTCGAPFGRTQCTECNTVMLARAERDHVAFDGCASAVLFDDNTANIARTYKDQGERRLSATMALLMARAFSPTWNADAVSFVPASRAAKRKRGFDHAELLAKDVARLLHLPLVHTLARPRTRDQRSLSRGQRWTNTAGRFTALENLTPPASILLIDDVYTTGATLFEATDALREAGAQHIYGLTFARVW